MNDDEDEYWQALSALSRGATDLGFPLSQVQEMQFVSYCRLLHETNAQFNLTAIRTPEGIMRTLFLDSLTCLLGIPEDFLVRPCVARVLDVGTGAGLPGLPLKLVCPEWRVTLIDSTRKKVRFVAQAIDHLRISDVHAHWARAEDLALDRAWIGTTDLCLARAVSSLSNLVHWCAPLVTNGGTLVFPRSGDIDAHLADARRVMLESGVRLHRVVPVPESLGLGVGRVIVVLHKRDTP